MDEHTEGDMFHDALSHHASRYKAALNSDNKPLANKHMHQIFKMMHMADKLTRDGLNDHSNGKLRVEAVHPVPWERSAYTSMNDQGKFKTDTKGWAAHTRGSTPNYEYLMGAPHEAYKKEVKTHGHSKAYPIEHMKVNDRHVHIDDIDGYKDYEDHPFDSHPIMNNFLRSPKDHDSLRHEDYLGALDSFHNETANKYWDTVESRGDAHGLRGKAISGPIHKDIPGLSLDDAQPEAAPVAVSQATSLPDKAPSLDDMRAKLAAIRGKK
jgi:hypothetical protein